LDKISNKSVQITFLQQFTIQISFIGIALFGAVFILLTFSLLLWFARRTDRSANKFLALALLAVVLWILRNWLPIRPSLALGPLIFFYTRKITRPEYRFNRRDILHFTPLLLANVVFHRSNPVLDLLAFISVIIYLFRSHLLIESFYKLMKFSGGDRYRNQFRWLQNILKAFGLLWLLWIPVAIASYFYPALQLYYFMDLLLVTTFIWLATTAFCPREIDTLDSASPALKPAVAPALREKGIWLKNIIRDKRYYEDPELNLRSLAEKLEWHTHELSRILNTVLRKSFNDFINEYRVKAVTRKIQDTAYEHITLLGIAYESGFNSQSTFTRIFKKMTGKSPLEYKNYCSSYKLGSQAGVATVFSSPGTTSKRFRGKSNRNFMLNNYLKTAWRNLMRNKSYATINVTGLAIGIAACLMIFLVVQYETSFDNFHSNKDHIYRVVTVSNGPNGATQSSGTQMPLAEAMRTEFPQLTRVGSIMLNDGSHYSVDYSKKFKEDSAYYADPQFFQIFDFKWLAGDKTTALAEPNTVVLSRDEADRFFGDWHMAMGKTIRYENKRDFKVTGILENTPANTDFPMRLVMSWVTVIEKGGDLAGNAQDWVSTFSDHNTYIILPAGMNEKQFNADLASFAKKHIPPPYDKVSSLQLQALKDMHYNTLVDIYSGHPFSKQLINVISLIGMFLLIIACANFINLATAQAVNRSKEVGIRKVLGSNRYQLVWQFISETLIVTLCAVILACAISLIALPMLNALLDVQLHRGFLLDSVVLLFLLGVVIAVTFLAGFYPALVLSGFDPIQALKNKIKAGRASGISLRRVLVVAQFCIAQILVIGTLVLINQMNYFKNKSLGFNKDAVVTVPFPGDSISKTRINALKEQLLQQPGIKDISISLYGPSDASGWYSDFKFNNSAKQVEFGASLKWADPEYFRLYDIQFLAGGPYKESDTISGYVVNETLIHKLGIIDPKQAIGKNIMLWNDPNKKALITGVVKDFNVGSLRNAIPPVLMAPWKAFYAKLNIKIQPGNVHQTLAGIESLWNKTYPEGVYEYQFLDKTIADFYKSEDELSSLYKIFAGIAIFIACLGLYGLVSFMALQRIKEVGIRKILGASMGQIVYLFSKEFTVLIIVAFAIASPIGYYFMHKWLQDFTYRITIGPDIFVLAIVSSVAVAWIAVGYKAVRASLVNPVRNLRSE